MSTLLRRIDRLQEEQHRLKTRLHTVNEQLAKLFKQLDEEEAEMDHDGLQQTSQLVYNTQTGKIEAL